MSRAAVMLMYRNSFISFVKFAYEATYPGKIFYPNWHIDVIAAYIDLCRTSRLPRFIINAPPRSLKSFVASIAFPAFALGRDPTLKIMSIVANQQLVTEITDTLERLMLSDCYRALFPHVRIARSRGQIKTTAGGSFISTPLYISPIGRGADLIILDDPMSPTDAKNSDLAEKAYEWVKREVLSRLNDKAKGAVILVMQRLSRHDLSERFESSGWKAVKLSAIARTPEVWLLPDGTSLSRPVGDVLIPTLMSKESLYDTFCEIGFMDFSAQYLQDSIWNPWINPRHYYDYDATEWTVTGPQPKSEMMFSAGWFVRYECFGIGRKPPYNTTSPITKEQEEAHIIYSQAKLIAECDEDCL